MTSFFSLPSSSRAASRTALCRALALALPVALAACGGGGGGSDAAAANPTPTPAPTPAGPRSVAITFAAQAGSQAVKCGTPITGLGTGRVSADLHDLRFYVSNVALLNDKGEAVPVTLEASDWQNQDVALIDLEDGTGACADAGTAAMNLQVKGTVPAGSYQGLKLTVGVPARLNHTDYAVAAKPMDVQALAWSWQAGRKFAQIEVNPAGGVARPAPAAAGKTFYVHLGSTGCTGNPVTGETVSCARPDRMDFSLPGFDPARQKVVLDLAALYAGTDLNTDQGGAPGCMSGATDPECAPIFKVLQLDLATGQPINSGSGQTLFRAEAL
ncbi:MbnP family copper-binding protein [Paracidovorax wautersii]|uniref:AZL_007920/MXAN_0976 family protein n=1 Tax=Paracidovorax wautersii TaxID=1177982 RepID=A0A1I2GQM1_9BURK|nr:MbnP family copper-binding protein [Paracidovorax wautersii]SFF19340.1 AZL_007920/MXAN_0976 family protein [Paracidovorax wautersii]